MIASWLKLKPKIGGWEVGGLLSIQHVFSRPKKPVSEPNRDDQLGENPNFE